ncbi:tripartite tricarboxylate transporter substrate binding protein [Ramlibacter sp. AW1]|uniref:Tripartite tricarboxylate transporter substrate binding protein n=1 Tax=Ramlibacter aurantiacus TaxID=2801330 RepID=A0A936ZK60_9BURK|nr:tripartite tricarboxylate transporter substrate binding protein [Ramlibacter aurantiacus]MBL0419221.1 tripartite tricarboxylate transporter substrate binding protein [Ramlibacter aurantiacus]
MTTLRTPQNPTRRHLLGGALCSSLAWLPGWGWATSGAYPTRAVSMIAAFAAGGPNDIVARSVADPLKDALKQSVPVENVTGAGGLIATRRVLSAPADGYTLLAGAAYLVTAPHLYKSANFDPAKDLVPVSPPIESLLVLVSANGTDLGALVENAKRTGKPITLASPGAGTLSHLGGEMLKLATGAPMVHVPYRGVGPAITDIMGGHADLMIDGMSSSLPHIRDGRLKALAVPDDERNPLLPQVPTTTELGLPSVKVRAWNAIFARAGTPQPVLDLLTTEVTRIVRRPELDAELRKRGLEPSKLSAAAFRERMGSESAHWKSVVQSARISIE